MEQANENGQGVTSVKVITLPCCQGCYDFVATVEKDMAKGIGCVTYVRCEYYRRCERALLWKENHQ